MSVLHTQTSPQQSRPIFRTYLIRLVVGKITSRFASSKWHRSIVVAVCGAESSVWVHVTHQCLIIIERGQSCSTYHWALQRDENRGITSLTDSVCEPVMEIAWEGQLIDWVALKRLEVVEISTSWLCNTPPKGFSSVKLKRRSHNKDSSTIKISIFSLPHPILQH